MENLDEISNSSFEVSIIQNDVKQEKGENIFFFISSFHNWIWNDKSCFFGCKKPLLNKITFEYVDKSDINEDYSYRIFCLHFNNNKKENWVYLLLNYEHLKNLELKELNLKDKKRFTFSEVQLSEKFLPVFLTDLHNKYGYDKFSKDNYYLKIEPEKQLEIYKNYLEKEFIDNQKILNKYSEYLACDFLYTLKKLNLTELNFSTAVNLFILSHNNKFILSFLEICNNFIYQKDNINKDFFNLINDYAHNKLELSRIFSLHKRKWKLDDYKKQLNIFLYTYYSFYKKDNLCEDTQLALKVKDILLKLINNRKNLIETTKMIYEYIDVLNKYYDVYDPENSRLKVTNIKNINNFNIDELNEYYLKIVKYQMENIKEYFIDYTEVIQKLRNIYKSNLIFLGKIVKLFKYELNQECNFELRKDLTVNYFDVGMKSFQYGNLKNDDLLNFIQTCDVFKSSKINEVIFNDKFINNYNFFLNHRKTINVLNGLDILSNNGPNLILKIKQMNLYKYFSNDMPKEYIEFFTKKITHIKNLGIFFDVLPKDKYKSESIFSLNNWVNENLETFSNEECKNFKVDINNFFEVLIILRDDLVNDFLKNLVQKLNIFCIELFLFFLNNNKALTQRIIKDLILYLISSDSVFGNYIIQNSDNIKYFIQNFTNNDDKIINIFLDELENLSLDENDLFELIPTKNYKLFKLLLMHKKKFIINKKGKYLDKTKSVGQEIIMKLKAFKYNSMKLKIFFNYKGEKENYRKKIEDILFFLSKEEKITKNIEEESIQIYEKLSEIFEKAQQIKGELGEASYYLDCFFNKKPDKIKLKIEINNFIKELWERTLAEIESNESIKEKLIKYNEIIKVSKPIIWRKKNLSLFNIIYESNKQKIEDQNYLLEETLKNFNSAVKLIRENPEKIQNSNFIIYYYKIGYQDENLLDKEIDLIIKNEKVEVSEEQKTKLLSSLKLLIKKQNIINVIKGILILEEIYEKNLHPSQEEQLYFNGLKEKLDLLNQKISSKEIESIINFIKKQFKEISFDNNDSKYKNYILPFFNSFNMNQEAFLFLKEKKPDDVTNLKEFLLDTDENELTLYEIDEFIGVIKFLNDDIMCIEHPFLLIQKFISGILDKKQFMDYLIIVKNYNRFKSLFDKFLNGEKGIFYKVRDIMNDSSFVIELQKEENKEKKSFNNLYKMHAIYNKNSFLEKDRKAVLEFITPEEIDDLYERIFISLNQERNRDYIPNFIQYYKYMKTINNLINEIFFDYGYPEKMIINFVIKVNFKCFLNLEIFTPSGLITHFKNIKQKCERTLNEAIASSDEIRLFYGQQLYLINNCLKKKEFDKIKDLISCATNGFIKEFNDNFDYFEDPEKDLYENMINNIKRYIQNQFEYNKKLITDIYLKNVIQKVLKNEEQNISIVIKENEYKGFFFYGTNIDEYDILNIFLSLTNSIPMNSNILFCNKETTTQEINTFLLKAIYCQLPSLFLIFIPKYINNSQKVYLIKLLRAKRKEAQMTHSCLVILFNFEDSEFHQSILKIDNLKLIKLPNIIDIESKISQQEINAEIISSKMCGLGKTTVINKQNINGEIIYLPIGGDLTKEDLTQRIVNAFENVKIESNKKYILHVDFTQTDNTEIIKDLLFKLLILKKFENKENVIYIKENIKIYIEIANDFFSYFNEYKILTLFSNSIKLNSINKFEFEKNEDKENAKKVAIILTSYKNNQIITKNSNFDKDYIDIINKENYIKEIILEYLKIKKPNYYQIKSFIRILAFEFDKFNKYLGFEPELLKENFEYMNMSQEEALNIRKLIIQCFINVTKHFTSGPFEELLKTQENAGLILKEKNMNENFIKIMENQIEGITYNDIKPSLVVFNLDGYSVSILTTLSDKDAEFKKLETLFKSQNIDQFRKGKNASKLKNLASLSGSDILSILKNFLNINLTEDKIKQIVGNYVYTADNLIKVILIVLRIKAKVPVIMMGETGCGKTRLIEMAFKLINKNKKASIKKLDIHAGTNDDEIINFIERTIKEVENEDERLYSIAMTDKSNEKNKEEIKNDIYNREIWIFFDEINTCNSMGLLSEILCKNSYRGKPINERFVFIAACNPYRLLTHKRKMDEILLHKKVNKNMLVYSVNPLPHSLLNFVLYFGKLKASDEKEYIKSMVKSTMESYSVYYLKNKKEFDYLINMQTECISIAHNFLKIQNDVSIVSLREVNRFLELFKYFENFIQKRNKDNSDFNSQEFRIITDEIVKYYNNKSKFFYHKAAVNLSLFLCYYLRLPDKATRKELENKFDETKFFQDSFLTIPKLEMDYLIDNFIIPKGIAKNRALKENLFSALFCIVNKIPLIICGKPGRSKTLCIQILQNSLKGKAGSKSFLCRSFPELIIYKIQGALNTKTDEVLKVFEEARKKQKDEKGKTEQIYLVLMDEMGLAELSPNNPLKVTHFELEREGDDKVPFVGITNWALDASKMNRVIYIVVQDPDEDDLILTAKEIVYSYGNYNDNYYNKYGQIFNNLAKAYYDFIKNKKEKNDENKYFHGSRDFYCLIKNVISDIIKNKEKLEDIGGENEKDILLKICMKNIERNFGGLDCSVLDFKSKFIILFENIQNFQIYHQDNLLGYLKESLYDTESRYLLLISESSISEDILKYMIEEINTQVMEENKKQEDDLNLRKKEIKVFLGSKFKSDENSIYYCNDILYKIKCQMETENIIILKDLEIVYPSLYELFNQNFIHLLNIKFARLGKSSSLSMVNDKFKVIVLVDKENIPKEDPPFINRFEKHIVSFNDILNYDLIGIAKEIELIINDIKKYISQINEYQKNLSGINYKYILNTNIKFINNEEIRGLVYIASKRGLKEKGDIINFVFNKIVPIFTEDIMIILQKFGFKAKYDSYFKNILNIYESNYKSNLNAFLENCSNNISIIYTFSFINDLLFENPNERIYNVHLDEYISKNTVKEILISEINSMKKLDKFMINFIMDEKSNLCIVKFKEHDLIKLSDVYNLINGFAKNNFENNWNRDGKKRKKICIILIHITRVVEYSKNNNIKNDDSNNKSINKYYISFLCETPQYFIDNINNKNNIFIDVLNQPSENIMEKLIKKNKIIKNQIINTIIYFDFFFYNIKQIILNDKGKMSFSTNEVKIKEKQSEINKDFLRYYKDNIIYKIVMDEDLQLLILKTIINFIKRGDDIFIKIFKSNKINIEENDFIEGLNNFLEKEIRVYLVKTLYLFDLEQILVSFICNNNLKKSKLLLEKMNNYVDNINNVNINKINFENINLNNRIKTQILFGIKIPFVQNVIRNNIFKFIKNEISKEYNQNESILIKKIESEKLHNEIKRYQEKYNELNYKLKNELMNYQFISNILENGDEQLIKDLFSDCFLVFLMKSSIFYNDYNYLIQLLEIIIQLRFKPRLNKDIDIHYYSNELNEKIEFSNSFLDIYKENENNKDNNINEIIIEQNRAKVSYM